MVIVFALSFFILASVMVYFAIMFMWPEWVGISGKDSEKTLQAHREESPERLQRED